MADTSNTARRAVFSPLEAGGRVDAVIDRLEGAISLGLITHGEQLPRETELASALGVSTLTVREALAQLRSQGLVETRRGRGGGSFANAPVDWDQQRSGHRLQALGAYELRDLGDLTIAIFGMAARRAAERASDEQITRLDSLASAMAGAQTPFARRQADGRFQVEVAASAQSVRLATTIMSLQTEYSDLFWIEPPADEDTERFHRRVVESHRLIVDAIRLRDPILARNQAEERAELGVERLLNLYYLLTLG
ncbi:MAG: GntR family transcriptional regulator [Actinomycetia bacterium]|nr:GntR family transcriptional regulator [Actinomycetes bacterium]